MGMCSQLGRTEARSLGARASRGRVITLLIRVSTARQLPAPNRVHKSRIPIVSGQLLGYAPEFVASLCKILEGR